MTDPTALALVQQASASLAELRRILSSDPVALASFSGLVTRSLSEELAQAADVVSDVALRLRGEGPDGAAIARVLLGVEPTVSLNVRTYAAAVRNHFESQFALHYRISTFLQKPVTTTRTLDTRLHVALNLLMTQAYTAHVSVGVIAELGQMGDAATLTRRLLELAVRAIYISRPLTDLVERDFRVDAYLGWLWRELDETMQQRVPVGAREPWEIAERVLAASGQKKPVHWSTMFQDNGQEDLRKGDYRLLSTLAHGSSLFAPLHYSSDVIPIRDVVMVPAVLDSANRYCLAVTKAWNDAFLIIDAGELDAIVREACEDTKGTRSAPDARDGVADGS